MERGQVLDRERQRIATEVHDDLGADVSHLLMLARQTVESRTLPKEDIVNVTLIEDHASGLARKVDEIIWSLDARDDHMLTTIAFIQRQVENTCSELGIAFRTAAVTGPDGPMPSRARRELYLLLRETLNNIVKHSDPRTLRFEASLTATVASFMIEHDGHGQECKENGRARGGYGQENIRQRLERLQGEVVATSAHGLFRTTIHIRRDQYPPH